MPTVCTRCHRELHDPVSIAAGMGPLCRSKSAPTLSESQTSMTEYMRIDTTPLVEGIVLRRDPDGVVVTNVPQIVIWHSPTGFEWGYEGSGPADLAANIVEVVLNRLGYRGRRVEAFKGTDCWDLTAQLHQDFKREFVANVPRKEGGVLDFTSVVGWVEQRMAQAIRERADWSE